jgi:hypothetical protein
VVSSGQPTLDEPDNGTPGKGSRFSRSRQMIQALRRDFIYSEKRARDILFSEIAAILRDGGQMIVSRLAREAASHARTLAEQTGYELSNWDTAAKATVNAMLSAGVLLGEDGSPIPFTIAAQATPVTGLREGYEDRTEAFLLEFLIRKLGDVTARDHTPLAHALFRQFDPRVPLDDLEDRVVVLLASLADRVAISDAGVYYVITGGAAAG